MAKKSFSDQLSQGINITNRAIRLSVLLARQRKKFEQVKPKRTNPGDYLFEDTNKTGTRAEQNSNPRTPKQTDYFFEQAGKRQATQHVKDYIAIIDLDYGPTDSDKKFYEKIILPFVPRSVDINPESNFVGIATLGRNNPNYHFVGSEDTITFEIDWFSQVGNREDVIFNCRWLEALTKADGYNQAPHSLAIIWGQDNKLFKDQRWICVGAPYTLSGFVDSYREDGQPKRVGLLPQQAKQKITLKRITDFNRTTREIISPSTYQGGRGKLMNR